MSTLFNIGNKIVSSDTELTPLSFSPTLYVKPPQGDEKLGESGSLYTFNPADGFNFSVQRPSGANSGKKYVLGKDGFIYEVPQNTPAIEFNADGSYKGVLVEPTSTNLLLYSEEFDNGSWTTVIGGSGVTPVVTANAGIAPDGTTTADRIQLDVGAGTLVTDFSIVGQNITVTAVSHTYSVWLKSYDGTDQFVSLRFNSAPSQNITITSEWQRFTFTGTPLASTRDFGFDLRGNNPSGEKTADFLAWGAQVEASPIATSYIPTTTAAVTRVKDDIYLTSASSLIGQTEGTLYCEFIFNTESDIFIIANALNGTTDYIGILRSENNLFFRIRYNSSNNINFTTPHTIGQRYKVAIAYKSGDTAVFVNGSQVGTTSTTAFSFSTTLSYAEFLNRVFYVSPDDGAHHYRAVALFTSRLTDTELAKLTSL